MAMASDGPTIDGRRFRQMESGQHPASQQQSLEILKIVSFEER
jgi:hypothetical protein